MKRLIGYIILILPLSNCVDRLYFEPQNQDQGILMVDGYISDEPGPYEIRLFASSDADGIINYSTPIEAKQITLIEDTGLEEVLLQEEKGVYHTAYNGIRGKIGKKYYVRIEMPDGTIFVSEPEEILPGGTIDSIYYQFEARKPLSGPTEHGFRVFMDATSSTSGGYARWKYTGVFSLETYPQLNNAICNCCRNTGGPAPLPCSGYVLGANGIQYVGECTCCISYISEPEPKPHLNDNAIQTNGTFKKIEMGYVDFNEYNFSRDRYMLKVEQMSLTPNAYEYWKIFRDQKQGAESLFQPAFGRAKSNIQSINSNVKAGGYFYATSIHKKVAFIIGSRDAGVRVPQFRIQPPQANCGLWSTGAQIFKNSSVVRPPEWVD